MTHLSPSEFVELTEGTLGPARAAHVDTCDACRAQAARLRATRATMDGVDIPEPSPLFWNHFSARVRDRIRSEPWPATVWWKRPAVVLLWAAALLAIVVVPASHLRPANTARPTTGASSGPEPRTVVDSPANDQAWELLRSVASDMALDEAHAAGLGVRPGAIENAVLDLTPAEREELGRLLRIELKRSGA